MGSFIDNLNPKEWEDFCEIMLRQQYGNKNFYPVPDQDGGDLGLEFFTADGTLFQCYSPEHGISMKEYKKRIQNKINKDLSKLKENESEIFKLLDGIVIDHWVLLTQKNKSKDLIKYCNKKKKEVIEDNVSYIDSKSFSVKIETADSYPSGKLYAQGVYTKAIDIPLLQVTENDKAVWKDGNAEFFNNIKRKSDNLFCKENDTFKDRVVTKYIQIEKFLDQLRIDHPDLHGLVEDSAMAQLENMQEESLFESELDETFVKNIVAENKKAFFKHSEFMSDKNMQTLSFGYLSKWLAECYMDFDI